MFRNVDSFRLIDFDSEPDYSWRKATEKAHFSSTTFGEKGLCVHTLKSFRSFTTDTTQNHVQHDFSETQHTTIAIGAQLVVARDGFSGTRIAGRVVFIMVALFHIEARNHDQGSMLLTHCFLILIPRLWSMCQCTDLDNGVQHCLAARMVVLPAVLRLGLGRALRQGILVRQGYCCAVVELADLRHAQGFDYNGSGTLGPMLVVHMLHWKRAAFVVVQQTSCPLQSHLENCSCLYSLLCGTSNPLNSSIHASFGLLGDVRLLALARSSCLLAVPVAIMGEQSGSSDSSECCHVVVCAFVHLVPDAS